ncbi:hypothetical protein PYW07_008135 [Mythimna separata]|uniref:Endonuclease/exonuclease/phosphatase domain-containing protein n=1 Tax=Mythimna separata TaxID=271217 RepID=A0AAD7YQG0_MYTSE|nr:hypothetical protein PYW07_008135 [Mythimna separata]
MVYRRDRESAHYQCTKEGGGVLIAINKKIKSKRIKVWESDCEDLWVSVDLPISSTFRRMVLCAVYLPPPVHRSSLDHYLDHCNAVFEQCTDSEVFIVGDFNLSNIDWSLAGKSVKPSLPNKSEIFIDFVMINRLNQLNSITNDSGRILDLVLSTHLLCSVTESINPISNVDKVHPPLDITVTLVKETSLPYNNSIKRPNFRTTNYAPVREFLKEMDWVKLFEGFKDVNEMLDVFYEKLDYVIDKFIPSRAPSKRKFPPWFNHKLIKMLNSKNNVRKRYHKYKNPMDLIELKLLSKRCESLATLFYNDYVMNIENKLKNNPKLFWTYVKNKRGGSSTYPISMTDGSSFTSDGTTICEMFATNFSSVYSHDQEPNDDYLQPLGNSSLCLTSPTISSETLLKKLKSLDVNKGAQIVYHQYLLWPVLQNW